ncbi:hypothetical protein KRP22_001790 [Phytophthora ramorum]|nr:putative alpha-1,3-mannosyltransferase MNN14 [Phytophthora ramorum]
MAKDKKNDKLSLSKAVARNRKWLLLLAPLLVVYGLLVMVTTDGGYEDSGGPTSPIRSFLRHRQTLINGTLHPTSPFYQRGASFDVTVKRDRGVLTCMNNGAIALGVSLIRELRCLGNEELIQVYHCGAELSKEFKTLLFNVDNRLELVDVCGDLVELGVMDQDMADKFRNWWIKPLAMYHTDVRHVMLMDVDDISVKNPAALRDLKPYRTTGTTFFYDRVHSECYEHVNGQDGDEHYLRKLFATFDYGRFNVTGGEAPSKHVLGSFAYTGKTCHEMDSSLVLVDKERAGQTVMDIMLWFITEERFRFRYSFGDKETFWLAFEMAHVPYSFSPWGVSGVSSTPNRDMEKHPDTLCGSILQYMPVGDEDPEMLYVNGKALLDAYPEGIDQVPTARWNNMFNSHPTHMTPRLPRTELGNFGDAENIYSECLLGLGSTPLPEAFIGSLLRRRLHYWGVQTGMLGTLQHCETYAP